MVAPISKSKINPEQLFSLEESINMGIEFLHCNQFEYGEFKLMISKNLYMERSELCLVSSPYITTLILHSLSFVANCDRVERMVEKSLRYLTEEMEMPGVWRFYTKHNRKIILRDGVFKRINAGIIPDLDDTACASHCLEFYGKPVNNKHLFYEYLRSDGSFQTWFFNLKLLFGERDYIPPYNNVCCGVNANILMYLGNDPKAISACKYINNVIIEDREAIESQYFPNVFVIYYLISRAYDRGAISLEACCDRIVEKIEMFLDRDPECLDLISIILSIATLLNFNRFTSKFDKWIGAIVEAQNADGSWPCASFFIDTTNHYGSPELTTAIALEVLSRAASAMS